ncbi:MAG: trimethylamine methyltransferase family protein [Spirochaetota bacterium]
MRMERFKTLSTEELNRIDAASVEILSRVGVKIQSNRAIEIFADGGAEVEKENDIVKLPEWLIRDAISGVPSHIDLYNRELTSCITLGDGRGAAAPGHNAVYIIDYHTGEQRKATCSDCDKLVRLADTIKEYEVVAVPVMPQDVRPRSSIIHGFFHTIKNTEKHIYFSPDSADATSAIIEITKAASHSDNLAEKPPITCQLSPTSPLVWDSEAAEAVILCAEEGIPLSFLPEPFSGMTGPITTAGLLAQHNAELLSGLVLAQLVKPHTPVIYGSAWTTFDMKKANILICSPEAAILRVAGAQLASYYRIPSHTIGPDADSHCYDEQLGWEKMLSTMAALGSGVDLIVNAGLFDSAWSVSLEQIVVDAEIISICRRFLQGLLVNDDTLAVDVIAEVGCGKHFMESAHTLRWLRGGALWEARISNTYTPKQWFELGKPDVMKNAAKKVDELLSAYMQKPLGDDAMGQINSIIEKFEAEHS